MAGALRMSPETEQQCPHVLVDCGAWGLGLHSHPHQRLQLWFTQGDQPVAMAFGWSPAASLAGGAVSQLPLGESAELGPYLWTWGGSRGMLTGSCALDHRDAGGLGSRPRLQHAPCCLRKAALSCRQVGLHSRGASR